LSGAALMHCDVIAALLQGLRAVVEGALVGVQIGSALSSVFGMLFRTLAWVGDGLVREESCSDDGGEFHDGRKGEGGVL
jgi:hypothetical protein